MRLVIVILGFSWLRHEYGVSENLLDSLGQGVTTLALGVYAVFLDLMSSLRDGD